MNPTNTLATGFAPGLEVKIQQKPSFSLPQLPERNCRSPATQSKPTLQQQALAAAGKSPTCCDALGWHGTTSPSFPRGKLSLTQDHLVASLPCSPSTLRAEEHPCLRAHLRNRLGSYPAPCSVNQNVNKQRGSRGLSRTLQV